METGVHSERVAILHKTVLHPVFSLKTPITSRYGRVIFIGLSVHGDLNIISLAGLLNLARIWPIPGTPPVYSKYSHIVPKIRKVFLIKVKLPRPPTSDFESEEQEEPTEQQRSRPPALLFNDSDLVTLMDTITSSRSYGNLLYNLDEGFAPRLHRRGHPCSGNCPSLPCVTRISWQPRGSEGHEACASGTLESNTRGEVSAITCVECKCQLRLLMECSLSLTQVGVDY